MLFYLQGAGRLLEENMLRSHDQLNTTRFIFVTPVLSDSSAWNQFWSSGIALHYAWVLIVISLKYTETLK